MTNTESSHPADLNRDDPRVPLRRALKLGAIGWVVVTIISLSLWGAVAGLPGLWAVLIGTGIGGGFVLFTALTVLASAHTDPNTTLMVVLGGWLLKIVLLLVVLFLIRDLEFYDRVALFVTVVACLIVVLGAEVWGVITARVSNVY